MNPVARWRNVAAALVASCLLALVGAAAAQAVTSTGTSFASVALSGIVDLRPQASLRLPLDTVTFDLRPGADPQHVPACVVGTSSGDINTGDALGAGTVSPAGTTFRVTPFPTIEVLGGEPVAVNELPIGNRAVVCYRSFVMEAFSNAPGWQLTVDRPAAAAEHAIENLYVGAACRADDGVGMHRLDVDDEASLVVSPNPGSCSEILVVMAVKPGQEPGGTAIANVRYTLMAPSEAFGER